MKKFILPVILFFVLILNPLQANADTGMPSGNLSASYNEVTKQLNTSGSYTWSHCSSTNTKYYVGFALFSNTGNPQASDNNSLFGSIMQITENNQPCKNSPGTWSNTVTLSQAPSKICVAIYDAEKRTNGQFIQTGDHSILAAGTNRNKDNAYDSSNKTFPANSCITPTIIKEPTPSPTKTPTPTPNPTFTPTPTPTTVPASTLITVVGMDGIWSTGDNANPDPSSSNKNPIHPKRNLTVEFFNSSNNQVLEKTGTIDYQTSGKPAGKFMGIINLGNFTGGPFTIKVTSDAHLTKQLPGIFTISGGENGTQQVNLVSGDVNEDNVLSILDYNILLSCSIYSTDNKGLCNSQNNLDTLSDLDDNGTVDQFDYNLFVREFSVQNGD